MTEKPVKKVEISEEELANLKAEAANAQAAAAKAKNDLEALKRKRVTKTPPQITMADARTDSTRPETGRNSTHSHEDGKPHYIGAWQQFCPTCGDRNPEFKDETVCEDCGVHLGAKEMVEKLKACPNCGGHRAKGIKT